YVIGGVGTALVGLLGAEWTSYKVPPLEPVYQVLPRLLVGVIPGVPVDGINTNQLAGALLLPVFVTATLVLGPLRIGRQDLWLRVALWGLLLLQGGVLLLTQSRGAYVGFAVGALALLFGLAVASRAGQVRRRIYLVIGAVSCGGALLLATATFHYDVADSGTPFRIPITLAQRIELWRASVLMLRQHPLTGI